ncbi:MAG: NAD(P)/FAD-dependent oxidoreductase [Chloroflexia bacterium]
MRVEDPYRYVALGDGTEISCSAMLISTGVSYRKLNVPGMDTLTGAGVYYGAAMTEAISCQDEGVYIIGAANSAGQAAVYFARYAREVTILCRGAGIASGMSQYLVDQIEETPNIRVLNYTIVEVRSKDNLDEIVIKNSRPGAVGSCGGAVVFIGAEPGGVAGGSSSAREGVHPLGADLLEATPEGLKPARGLLETSVPGVFVAGDVRHARGE